ncbi:phosphocholine-specific phospholipase C [Gluconacetobacter entanii]|uniref:phospholipase C n=1 Tax=Gluconacetobacter entanii TaxID=108528 RepID=A0A318PTS5_9PROT|nr:phospholipase C, phosphocholine-specific [Gluconacetobacter entanii]PYD62578.1 phospholipase C, phosphocholine-specific [Gluconacetobacter entanii]
MKRSDRRSFLKFLGAGVTATALHDSIRSALALPANTRTRSIRDVEHIVILMQENRSFDHYYGTLSGVRGFGDPRAMRLPNGRPVWEQPHGKGVLLPFRPAVDNLGLSFIGDTPHDWNSTHRAWNHGRWDGWVAHKTPSTMIHFNRADIPFHYALADAFTICDSYHCSVMGPTYPNRNYMFTGWTGNDGRGHGPQLDTNDMVCDWPTYPERLEAAGVSWKIYQDVGSGLTARNRWGDDQNHYIGNSANNTLLRFVNYQTAKARSPLARKARSGTNIAVSGTLFDDLRRDVANATLPQVSWLICPNAYDEHPNWPANYGAWFISRIIETLTSNPDVWGRTALFITYDENDGFFDHIMPPVPPADPAQGQSSISTEHEIFSGSAMHDAGPYGLGPRVPMLVISPWSRGGWVNSEVFDHTSLIRFIERRFAGDHPGLVETQITPWRRAICGDLTSAFDFADPNTALPPLPATTSYAPRDQNVHPSSVVTLPTHHTMPVQEQGIRRARPLPYDLHVTARIDHAGTDIQVTFVNSGKAAAIFHVRDIAGAAPPRSYGVAPGGTLSDRWMTDAHGHYDLDIHGPNGFFRGFAGRMHRKYGEISVASENDPVTGKCILMLHAPLTHFRVEDAYTGHVTDCPASASPVQLDIQTGETSGWYDLILRDRHHHLTWRIAGHVETGRDSTTDPAIGRHTC